MSVKGEIAGSTGVSSASSILTDGRSGVPFPDLRTELALDRRWPSHRDASACTRYHSRVRELTSQQEATICTLAATRSLRSLAAEFDVSHETIRAVVRQDREALG